MLPCRTSLRSALRMCRSRSMGQILLPQGQGPFLGPNPQRWSRAAAVTLRKCSPHPPHQHHIPVGQAQRYQPADTFLLLPAAVTTLPLGTLKAFSCALLSHSIGLSYPGVSPNAIPMGNKTTSPSWLSQHWNRALQSSPFGSFCLWQQTVTIGIPMCTGWWQRKEPLQQQPWERGMKFLT